MPWDGTSLNVRLKNLVFCVMILRSFISGYRSFGRTYTIKRESLLSSRMQQVPKKTPVT